MLTSLVRVPRRRAATMVLFLCLFGPILLGMTALTVDVGRLMNTRVELQNAADAAALAAAQDLGGPNPIASILTAETTAIEYLGRNPVWNGQPITDYEITFGESRLNADGSAIDFTPGVVPANSLRVTAHYNMEYTFAQVFGFKSKIVSATAVAGIGARDFIMAMDASGSMTKQTVEADVCADLAALGVPSIPGSCKTDALALTYDGSMGGPEFWGVFNIGDLFLPPSVRVLPMKSAKDAAAFGVDVIWNAGYDDLLGVVGFGVGSPWAHQLTNDYATMRAKIRGLTKGNGSDIDLGILEARAELLSVRARNGADKVLVLFADGQSNAAAALAAAQVAADDGITIHTVGLGTGVDAALLQGIADIGGGTFTLITNSTDETVYGPQLKQAFQSIASGAVKYGLFQ